MIKKKHIVFIIILSLLIYVMHRYIAHKNENKYFIKDSTCFIDIVPLYPEEERAFYIKEYKILHDKGIKFLEEDKNGNKFEIDKNDRNGIFINLVLIHGFKNEYRKEAKKNKKEIIRKMYTLNGRISIPKHLEDKLVSNKNNYIVNNECEILRVLKGL